MPITLVKDKKYTCPVFVCDYCGKKIDDASSANYSWQHGTDNIMDIKYLHKKCTVAYEGKSGGCVYDMMELNHFLVYLLNNSGMTEEKIQMARESVRMLSRL